MAIEIVYETHSTTEDSERGRATGWLPGHLSDAGRAHAALLGRRRRDDGLAAIFVSDLARAVETVELAFAGTAIPVLHDWRLRECDYGRLNGAASSEVHGDRRHYLDLPTPAGRAGVRPQIGWAASSPICRSVGKAGGSWSSATRPPVWASSASWAGRTSPTRSTADAAWREGWEYRLG